MAIKIKDSELTNINGKPIDFGKITYTKEPFLNPRTTDYDEYTIKRIAEENKKRAKRGKAPLTKEQEKWIYKNSIERQNEFEKKLDKADNNAFQRIKSTFMDTPVEFWNNLSALGGVNTNVERTSAESQAIKQQAKEGLGKAGQFGLDVVSGAGQLVNQLGAGAFFGGQAGMPVAIKGMKAKGLKPTGRLAFPEATELGGKVASAGLMFGSGAGSSKIEATLEGATDNQILGAMLAGGSIETISEAIPLGRLVKIFQKAGTNATANIVKNALSQMGVEAGSEALAEAGQSIANELIYKKEVGNEKTLSEFIVDTLKQAGYAGLVGGVIGGGAGGLAGFSGRKMTPNPSTMQEGIFAKEEEKSGLNQTETPLKSNLDEPVSEEYLQSLQKQTPLVEEEQYQEEYQPEKYTKVDLGEIEEKPDFEITRLEGSTEDFVPTETIREYLADKNVVLNNKTENTITSGAKNNVSKEIVGKLTQIADKFDTSIVFDEKGKGVGRYEKGTIYINPASNTPIEDTFFHELTHHAENSGTPYAEFQNMVLNSNAIQNFVDDMDLTFDKYKANVLNLYKENGVELTEEGLNKEITAKFVEEKLFKDQKYINRLAKDDFTLFEKIKNWLDDTIVKLTGTQEEKELLKIRKMYENALKETKKVDRDVVYNETEVEMFNSEGNKLSPNQQKFFKNSKALNDNGELLVMYHGTNSYGFNVFDRDFSSAEGDMGKGFYFTSSLEDVEENYASREGTDVRNKISRLAEQIEAEEDIDHEEALKRAEEQIYGEETGFYEVYLNVERPVYIGNGMDTILLTQEEFEDLGVEADEPEGLEEGTDEYQEEYEQNLYYAVQDKISEIAGDISYELDVGQDQVFDILWEAFEEGGIEPADLKERINEAYFETDEGMVGNEVFRLVLDELGYDGIIDSTPSQKFKMTGLYDETKHIIVFNSNQIKNVDNPNPTDNEDIRFSIKENNKSKQLNIIKKTNPMLDEEHTGIRNEKDIKTLQEIFNALEDNAITPDYSRKDMENAIKTGKITIYSSKPINQGVFVTPSKIEALSYAGNGKVYTKTIPIENVAWIDEIEGQYADTNAQFSIKEPTLPKAQTKELPKPRKNKRVTAITKELTSVLGDNTSKEKIYNEVYKIKQTAKTKEEAKAMVNTLVEKIIDNSTSLIEGATAEYKDLHKYIRETPISMAKYKNDIGDYSAFKKRNEGKVKLRENGTPIDEFYQELHNAYGNMFPETTDPVTQLNNIIQFREGNKKVRVNQFEGQEKEATEFYSKFLLDSLYGRDINTPEDVKTLREELISLYGLSLPGEKPTRNIRLPKQTSEKRYLSKFAQTLAEAEVTSDEVSSYIEEEVVKGNLSHEKVSDKGALNYAERYIKDNGFKGAVEDWNSWVKSGKMTKDQLAVGQLIYNEAVQNKDVKLVQKMIADLTFEYTEIGRALQSARLLKKMTPDGQLYYLEKTVARLNKELQEKYKNKAKQIEIPEELAKELLNSKTKTETEENVEKITKAVAEQVPVTFVDKLNSWRYLSMLGNPRTHIRNIVGNLIFYEVTGLKDIVGATLETLIPKEKRTKGFYATKEQKDFALNDFERNKKQIRGESKWDIGDSIKDEQQIYKFKPLEIARKGNFNALEAEDTFFLRANYARALSRGMNARGITPKMAYEPKYTKTMDTLRANALKEAQEATFRDINAFSQFTMDIKKSLKKTKAGDVFIEGVLPFAKTPSNIVVRGVEYSPVGAVNGLYNLVKDIKAGENTNQSLDKFAKGLTGSGLVGVGILLSSLGMIEASSDEDRKKEQFETMQGLQNYAIRIGNKTYTVDWASPTAIPIFLGAELHKLYKEQEGFSVTQIYDALTRLTDPVLEMSMLQGVSDFFGASKYDNKTDALIASAKQTFYNYLGQFNPTLLGQISRTIDDTRRTTYVDKNKDIPADIQRFAQRQQMKIPFASKKLPARLDQFGREQVNESVVSRAFQNFISPGYVADINTSSVEKMLEEVYNETGESSVLPAYPQKYITVNGEKKELTAKQYEQYSKTRGEEIYKQFLELSQNKNFDKLKDEEKVEVINSIYSYSNNLAKEKVSDYKMGDKDQRIKSSKLNPYEYYVYNKLVDKNGNGSYSQKELEEANLPKNVKRELYKIGNWKTENPYK